MQNSEDIKQNDFEEVVGKTDRFKNSVIEKAKNFDGYVIYENRDIKRHWTMLVKSPPRSKDDIIGSCTNLEFFSDCHIYLFSQDQIIFELTVPGEVVGYHQEIVEAVKKTIFSWKSQ